MTNFGNMFKQAQQMQAKMAEAQALVDALEAEGSSGNHMVKVILKGQGLLKSITIDPSLLNPSEAEMVEDLIVAAFNDAKKNLDEKSNEIMNKAMGGMKLPGNFKLPF